MLHAISCSQLKRQSERWGFAFDQQSENAFLSILHVYNDFTSVRKIKNAHSIKRPLLNPQLNLTVQLGVSKKKKKLYEYIFIFREQ